MLSRLLQFAGSDPQLHFGRVEEDGLPYRGRPFHVKGGQADRTLVRAGYSKSKIFDITNPEDMAHFHDVLDKITCGWYLCPYWNPQYDTEKKKIFMIWVEQYMERAPEAHAQMAMEGPGYDAGDVG